MTMLKTPSTKQWPLLSSLLDRGYILYIDYAVAEKILNGISLSECLGAFLCYLSMAMRAGHLCVRIQHTDLYPDPQQLLREIRENDHQLSNKELEDFTALIIQGSKGLPPELYTDVDKLENHSDSVTPIYRLQTLFYLQRFWAEETAFVEQFQHLIGTDPDIIPDQKALQEQMKTLKDRLLPEQAKAILMACQKRFSIVCGGPGTGKTYTAGLIIKTYWESISPEQRKRCEIALAAPTGKAAANLQNSLNQAIGDLSGFPFIQAKTLHGLMNIRGSTSHHRENPSLLTADLIVIDESSMIDLHLLSRLFMSLKPGARLILLGDPHQLPPVSAGALFSDLITYLSRESPDNVVALDKCLRAELQAIVDFAELVKYGDHDSALKMLVGQPKGIRRLSFSAQENDYGVQKQLLAHTLPLINQRQLNRDTSPQQVLEAFSRFRILSPVREGPLGVNTLNALFMRHLMTGMENGGLFFAPIMLTHNDYRLGLFNGEVGVLVRHNINKSHDSAVQAGDYALFCGKSGETGDVRRIAALLLPAYEYAYCLSVHKSQGSEFDHVLLLMPEGAELFGREVFYTGVTRARKQLDIWGTDATLSATLAKQSHRLSGLSVRL